METLEIQLNERALQLARQLAESRGLSLDQLVEELLAQAAQHTGNGPPLSVEDPLWGIFASEPELIDQVVEDAMRARERNPLRLDLGQSST